MTNELGTAYSFTGNSFTGNGMRIKRRRLLALSIAVMLSPLSAASKRYPANTKNKTEFIIGAQGDSLKEYGIGWSLSQGASGKISDIGFRGHGGVQNPKNPFHVILFSRSPGIKAISFNLDTKQIEFAFECQEGFHFLGHGCFSADGGKLFTTEADYVRGLGKIVVRETETFNVIDIFDSGGIGPHELKLMPDKKTLVVANGGLLTHPKSGRKVLNLETMQSNLCYVDSASGECLESVILESKDVPEHNEILKGKGVLEGKNNSLTSKSSIRHLDVSPDGIVVFAMQVQRKALAHNNLVPLAAVHQRGKSVVFLDSPDVLLSQLKDYVGSVAINNTHRVIAATSPKGNIAVFWSLDTQVFLGYHSLFDVCGVAVCENDSMFALSNSRGELRFIKAESLHEDKTLRSLTRASKWDNHLLTATL